MVCYLIGKQFLVPEFLKLVKFPIRPTMAIFSLFFPKLEFLNTANQSQQPLVLESQSITTQLITSQKRTKFWTSFQIWLRANPLQSLSPSQKTTKPPKTSHRQKRDDISQRHPTFSKMNSSIGTTMQCRSNSTFCTNFGSGKSIGTYGIFSAFLALISDTFITTNQKHVQKQSNGKKKFAK